MSALETTVFFAYCAVLVALASLGVHRLWLVWWSRSLPALEPRTQPRPAVWPSVTVQAPLYNEREVAGRLVDALAALRYPRDRLHIQVLDDSDDDTPDVVARAVDRARAGGIDVDHVRRGCRDDFKAGALAHGLASARGDLIAVFDADFVPAPDFLERVAGEFDDASVGMVQARWGHLNEPACELTRVQALLLDGHFCVEHAARARAGCFFNFNGTAGVWRRACIDSAGGWQGDTLTEDLDLSYRAQLAGWRFVYRPDVVSPAELPSDMNAFKRQQRRWSKGAAETARKLLGAVWRAKLPRRVKREATLHLTSSASYVLMVLLTLLLPLTVVLRAEGAASLWTIPELVALAFGTGSLALFYAVAGRRAGTRTEGTSVARFVSLMALGVGVSWSNALGVLEALWGRRSPFERTPKSGDQTPHARRVRSTYAAPRSKTWLIELAAATVSGAVFFYALLCGVVAPLPFLALFCVGYAWVGVASMRDARAPRVRRSSSASSCA